MEIDTRLRQPLCPWCKSASKSASLDVTGMGHRCYNDWHLPPCKNCGQGVYAHGHEFGCQRYESDRSDLEALFILAAAKQRLLRGTRDTAAIRASNLNTQMLMTAIGKASP